MMHRYLYLIIYIIMAKSCVRLLDDIMDLKRLRQVLRVLPRPRQSEVD